MRTLIVTLSALIFAGCAAGRTASYSDAAISTLGADGPGLSPEPTITAGFAKKIEVLVRDPK